MVRSYEFYKGLLNLESSEIDKNYRLICEIEEELSREIVNEDKIRLLNSGVLLKMILMEGKIEFFNRIVSLFPYQDGEVVRYRYLVDPVTMGIVDYLKSSECIEENILSQEYIEQVLDAIFAFEYEKIRTMKIKDVLAKQISGWNHPIYDLRDVMYYAEAPLLAAMIACFAKNIMTVSNDTNNCYSDLLTRDKSEIADLSGEVSLTINYDLLDESNKLVADTLVQSGHAKIGHSLLSGCADLTIVVNASTEDSVGEVSNKMIDLISRFSKQDMVFGKVTVQELIDRLRRAVAETKNMLKEIIEITKKNPSSEEELREILEAERILNFAFANGYDSLSREDLMKLLSFMTNSYLLSNYGGRKLYYDAQEDMFWIDESYYRRHVDYLLEQPNQGFAFKQ